MHARNSDVNLSCPTMMRPLLCVLARASATPRPKSQDCITKLTQVEHLKAVHCVARTQKEYEQLLITPPAKGATPKL